MFLSEVIDMKFGIKSDEWSIYRSIENDEIQVVGWSSRRGYAKVYIIFCQKCSEDPELFGGGFFKSTTSNIQSGQVSCGCSKNFRRSKEQYMVVCTRKANEAGVKFLGFKCENPTHSTKVILECPKHGVWETTSLSNMINHGHSCPTCALAYRITLKRKSDEEMIASFRKTGGFHPEAQFWRSERKSPRGFSVFWHVFCPECGKTGESVYTSLQRGSRSCNCNSKGQKEAYINLVKTEDWAFVAVKFGIANNSEIRRKEQVRRNKVEVVTLFVYEFKDSKNCFQAEKQCKIELTRGVLNKGQLKDGHTETVTPHDIIKIMQIYEENGGVLKYDWQNPS